MIFNSLAFLVFFPIVTFSYFVLPHKIRWAMLLIASCIFYMAFVPKYILILAATIIVDYVAGIWIEGATGRKRKWLLAVSIVANVGFLAFFKYFNFFNENVAHLAHFLHWNYSISALKIILPIGLSFHTFQAMSYTIEVYRGNQKAERHFGIYALYVMFYPQLVAGPIERPQNLLHQFREDHQFEYQRVTDGLKLMTWGMFKKVVIADRLAILVNQVYGNPTGYTGFPLILATVFFAFQIYCDFSGYSDIAIGSAQVMGFKLMDNFNRPYFSKSVAEFWKRWHISLSTWFKDYLYIPLGGNRVAKWRWQLNLFSVFLVSGLWHGANWTYIIWGALHGFYLVFSLWTQTIRAKILRAFSIQTHFRPYQYIQIIITFSLVCFAWIFFRAKDMHDAFYIAAHTFSGLGIKAGLTTLGYPVSYYALSLFAIGIMEGVHLIQRHGRIRHMFSGRPLMVRWALYYAILLLICAIGSFGLQPQFIYFQF